jgi:hypothetical protein
MFLETNEKLQQTKDSLVELIAELDMVLEDLRGLDGNAFGSDGPGSEPEYLRKVVRQREVLLNVAAMLAELRFERSAEAKWQRKA